MALYCPCDVDEEEQWYYECLIHVMCDEKCGALDEPHSLEELREAYLHWMNHGYLRGCSHAQ